jgi:hypothetical protein
MLLGLGLLLSPVSYHRVILKGELTGKFESFVTAVVALGLLPFALAIAIQTFITAEKIAGFRTDVVSGATALLVCLFFWYGLELAHRKAEEGNLRFSNVLLHWRGAMDQESQKLNLKDKIKDVLIEARMVLPGAQALLGFQFATFLI